ncbi:MAG: hypothetical protein CMO63_01615 [Verrucomicrobiales bacterium]|nr:hypothetical protein [Verrucomicrobiales bacterium]
MAWELIFTRNIGWKALSVLFAVAIWYTINGRQLASDPQRVKDQSLVEPKLETPTTISPLETPEVSTNRVNVVQSFAIRILQPPNDTNRYILDPAAVTLELASDADPAPNLTSPVAVKVMVDPIDLPAGINETNVKVKVSVPEDAIIKDFNPREVKVTRIIETPPPTEEPENLKEKPEENPDESEETSEESG